MMAASSSLSDLAGWTREDFANRWSKILPSLISEIEEKNETVIDIFRVIFVSIVPVVPVNELEDVIFSQICDKMTHHFSSVLDSVVQTAESLIEEQTLPSATAQELNVILEGLTNSIVSIATCLNYLSNLRSSLALANIRSLPYCVLDLMIRSFAHCKESGQLYGQLFGHVSDHLSGLFKATRLLQTNFSVMLEKLDVSYPSEQDKEDLCYIIQKLCGICDAASRLDVKIMVALWKTVSRLSCNYRDFLLNQLDMTELLTSLCDNMSSSSSYFCQQDGAVSQVDESSLGKMIKILGFQMRVLVTLAQEYNGYLGNSIGAIYQLVMQIKSFLPPSLSAQRLSVETREELMRHVGIGLEPLISGLIDNNEFISLVTRVHQEKSSMPSFGIARLMLLLTVAQLLPGQPDDVQSSWLVPANRSKDKPQQSLVVSLFSCISLCYKELLLPVRVPSVVQNGTAHGELSLYEHVVTRLCAFVVTFPVKNFAILESCLLENVLSRRQHCAMAAVDVWCFMARCGSAELCRDQCRFLMTLFTESHRTVSAECCHLVLLIRRLFRLMAVEHQAELVSSTSSLEALSILPLDVSSPMVCRTITDRATDHFSKAVTHWTRPGGAKTVGDAQAVLLDLRTLLNVCQSSVVIDDFFGAEQRSCLVAQCLVLLSVLPPGGKTYRHQRLLDAITSSVFYFLSRLAVNLNNRSVVQLLNFCDAAASPACKDIVKLSVLEVLGSFATKTFSPDNDQCQILRLIPKLFSRLLGDADLVVDKLAMEVFENFAQKTSHESLVPDSLNGNEQLRQKFISYIKQRASGFQPQGSVDVESVRMLGEAVDRWCLVAAEDLWTQESNVAAVCSDDNHDEEIRPPVFKRLRVGEDSDSTTKETEESEVERKGPTLRQTLDQLESTVSDLEELHQGQPLPDWGLGQLSEIKRRLAAFV